jgi:hypothetical protein
MAQALDLAHQPEALCIIVPQTTNLGVGSSNLFGRARITNNIKMMRLRPREERSRLIVASAICPERASYLRLPISGPASTIGQSTT